MIVKTPAEASGIPDLADNLRGISLAMSGAEAAHTPIDETRVAEECSLIRREVEAILESVLLCGRGSVSEGIVEGFRRGLLDIPFSPSIYNRGAVMTARDRDGAVRFLSRSEIYRLDVNCRSFTGTRWMNAGVLKDCSRKDRTTC